MGGGGVFTGNKAHTHQEREQGEGVEEFTLIVHHQTFLRPLKTSLIDRVLTRPHLFAHTGAREGLTEPALSEPNHVSAAAKGAKDSEELLTTDLHTSVYNTCIIAACETWALPLYDRASGEVSAALLTPRNRARAISATRREARAAHGLTAHTCACPGGARLYASLYASLPTCAHSAPHGARLSVSAPLNTLGPPHALSAEGGAKIGVSPREVISTREARDQKDTQKGD